MKGKSDTFIREWIKDAKEHINWQLDCNHSGYVFMGGDHLMGLKAYIKMMQYRIRVLSAILLRRQEMRLNREINKLKLARKY